MPNALPAQGEWTAEDVWRLPENGNRYEVIDGVLYVTRSPRDVHQYVVPSLRHIAGEGRERDDT